MLWVKDSPKLGTDCSNDIVNFIDKFIICHKPTEKDDKILAALVNGQMHHHSHTCRIGNQKNCRFHFPLMSKTCLLEPLNKDITEPSQLKYFQILWQRIQQHLHDMGMGRDITFEDYLTELRITEQEYNQAITLPLKTTTVFLKRKPSEIRVNACNIYLLLAWCANLDIQFITNVYA